MYLQHLKDKVSPLYGEAPRLREVGEVMKAELRELGCWIDKYSSKTPPAVGVQLEDERTASNYPLYPKHGLGRSSEPEKRLRRRMTIVREWLKRLQPGKRYVLVAHGEVSKILFQRKLDNLGVVVAQFRPQVADALDEEHFFHDVQLASLKWSSPDIPGWDQH